MAAGLTACGSSDKKSSGGNGGSGAKLAKADLIAKANAICAATQTKAKSIKAPASISDPTVAAKYLDQIAPITAKETADLAALRPADTELASYTDFINAQKTANDLIQLIRHKADTKDASGVKDLQKAAATGQKVADAATKLGATTCAGG
jgi:hypothetical protein